MNTLLLWLLLLPLSLFGSSSSVTDTLPPGVGVHASPLVQINGQPGYGLSSRLAVHIYATPTPAKPTWRTWPTNSAPRYTVLRWQWGLGVLASLIAGGAWGLHESTMHHWNQFANRFPNANPDFWNPAISWQNKYVDGDPLKGRTDTPVLLTDAKHVLASTALSGGFVAGASFTFGEVRPWWHYLADFLAGALAWGIGNRITYDWIYP